MQAEQTWAETRPASISRDADGLLQTLLRSNRALPLAISSSRGDHWLVSLDPPMVSGSPLHMDPAGAEVALCFAVRAGSRLTPAARVIALDQWVYWLARHAAGERLYAHRDDQMLSIRRCAASPFIGREFAKLMVAYGHPMTVAQAAARTHVDPGVVRRFINASAVLRRVRIEDPAPIHPNGDWQSAGSPGQSPGQSLGQSPGGPAGGPPSANASAQPGESLFGRLLRRLRLR